MFDDGLVDEVTALLDRGLRDGVTASRALGYAQVIAALDDPDRDGALPAAREQTFVGDPALRAPAAVVVPPRSPHPLARRGRRGTPSTTRCGPGGTYPEQVIFAKGHGTQNDFVLLLDVRCEAVAGTRGRRRAVRPPPRPRRRRGAAGDHGRGSRRRRCSRPAPRGCERAATGTWTTATPTGRSRRCAATACGCSRTTCGPAGWSPRDEFVVGSLAGAAAGPAAPRRRHVRRRHRRDGQGQPARHR